MKMKLAEALLLRKELQAKVDRLKSLDDRNFYEIVTVRKPVAEGIDEIVAQVPKISFQQFTHCYDWHAKQLRMIDGVIQQANWTTEVDGDFGGDYIDPYVKIKD